MQKAHPKSVHFGARAAFQNSFKFHTVRIFLWMIAQYNPDATKPTEVDPVAVILQKKANEIIFMSKSLTVLSNILQP